MNLDVLTIDKFVEINKLKEVTSSFILAADGNPEPEGIFSYDIFGRVGSPQRKINFGYIDLKRPFMHPLVYNLVMQMFRGLPQVIAGEKYIKLSPEGFIQNATPDDKDASTGINFFIDNWSRIKWNSNDSDSRERKENLFDTLKTNEIFITKWLVCPAMYRDINLHSQSSSGKIDMGEINAFYIRLINNCNSASITFTSSYATQTNVQNVLVEIHNFFTKKISGKRGVIRQAIMGKTVDYAVTSVISAPRFNSEDYHNQMIPYNYIGVPLYQLCALFYPFITKQLEDMFFDVSNSTRFTLNSASDIIETSADVMHKVDSDSLKSLVKAFIKDKTKTFRTSIFSMTGDDNGRFRGIEEELGRPFTITDLLYRAIVDVIFNKHVLSTRFPITGSESQIINRIKILTTEKNVDLSRGAPGFEKEYYQTYPYFPTDAKGNILSDKVRWLDTVIPNNSTLAGMGGDYDGDTFRLIGLFTNEANEEAKRILKAPMNYVDAAGGLTRGVAREAGMALYMLTRD